MKRPRLLWQIFPSFLAVILLALLAATWYAARSLRTFYLDEARADLKARALLLEDRVAGLLATGDFGAVDAFCKELGHKSATRLTVILPSGEVVGDSEEDPAHMDNHADRPEIVQAMSGWTGSSMRYSHTLRKEMMYVAIPLGEDKEVVAVLRASVPVASLADALGSVYLRIVLGGMTVAVVAGVLGLVVSRRLSRPLEEMRRGAERFARGELDRRLPVPNSEEIGSLAETLNQMAEQLDERIRTVTHQRNELEAVLASMVEGVIAVDSEERILSINRAAGEMIGSSPTKLVGRSIQEAIRNTALQEFVSRALSAAEAIEGDVVLEREGQKFVQAHGALLRDASGNSVGAVVVLNDVTRLRRLEDIRREFVANVSHELRTPVTAIKGFVETLLEGAAEKSGDTGHFLDIISRQTDRLNAIIEDLLLLSSVEQDAERAGVELDEMPLKPVLDAAVEICNPKSSEKNMKIAVECEPGLAVKANSALLEQAVVNLLDNAVKYSDEGGMVKVRAARSEKGAAIEVSDTGCGIDEEHLPRLFERFYRVDKARSRKLGGTGLGLAIVKHIAQAHGGSVSVRSTPAQGSIFTILLPQP